MNRSTVVRVIAVAIAGAVSSAAMGHGDLAKDGEFRYDPADRMVEASVLEGRMRYDADLLRADGDDQLWLAWLRYRPGQGDVVQLARRRSGGGWSEGRTITPQTGRFANPTLTQAADGTAWLSYEQIDSESGKWRITVRRLDADGMPAGATITLGERGAGNAINHSIVAAPNGGLWVAWQQARDGQFDVLAQRINGKGRAAGSAELISERSGGDWHATLAASSDQEVAVVWDRYAEGSFGVTLRRHREGRWGEPETVAASEAFEGKADAVYGPNDRLWVVWERGATGWGHPYRGNPMQYDNITDAYGPVHRFRTLRLAVVERGGKVRMLEDQPPMPMVEHARQRPKRREDVHRLGMYYERGELAVDGGGRVWLMYRHFYKPQVGKKEMLVSHRERGWRLYARCFQSDGWSKLHAFDQHQRDGLQRLSIAPTAKGLEAVWTIGRTDRHTDPQPRGLATASVASDGGGPSEPALKTGRTVTSPEGAGQRSEPETMKIGGQKHRLYFGDMHRHTDLSLCFPFFDGSIDDAYRYAIEEAELDYLAITDHARDIGKGDALSQLWWRTTKMDTRHHMPGSFVTFFSYERSRAGADHNVVSLRDDMLWPHTSPHPKFWARIDGKHTFTIPHNTTASDNPAKRINPATWDKRPEQQWKRPLVEVYQALRNQSSLASAQIGLRKGHRMGFIASSDHLSTRAAYACVWAPAKRREPIFDSLMNRRAYGATDKIRLIFRSGDHWMGERFTQEGGEPPRFRISVTGTAPVERIDVYRGDERVERIEPAGQQKQRAETEWRAETPIQQEAYFYVHVVQTDGNQAWASPIWVETAE